jgi:hypothetical protein
LKAHVVVTCRGPTILLVFHYSPLACLYVCSTCMISKGSRDTFQANVSLALYPLQDSNIQQIASII